MRNETSELVRPFGDNPIMLMVLGCNLAEWQAATSIMETEGLVTMTLGFDGVMTRHQPGKGLVPVQALVLRVTTRFDMNIAERSKLLRRCEVFLVSLEDKSHRGEKPAEVIRR